MIEQIVDLDRYLTLAINGSNSVMLDAFALIVTSTVAWLPIGLFMCWYIYRNYNLKTMLFVLGAILCCVLVADVVSSGIFKPLVERFRPSRDPEIMYAVDVVNEYRGGCYGFFSSHATNTCSVAVFLCCVFRNRSLIYMFALFTLVNCWSRIYLGVHYVGDVFVGLCFGTLVGLCVYRLYIRFGGVHVSDKDRYILVMNLVSYVAFLLLSVLLASFF